MDSSPSGGWVKSFHQSFTKKTSGTSTSASMWLRATLGRAALCTVTCTSTPTTRARRSRDFVVERHVAVEAGTTAVLGSSVSQNTWYNVKFGFDIALRRMDVWLNGTKKVTSTSWKGTGTNISKIVIASERSRL